MKQQILFLFFLFLFLQSNTYASVLKLLDSPAVWEDEKGVQHHLSEWKNQSLVVTMVYADCKKTCPMITAEKLREIHHLFQQKQIQAQFLVVTMDPESDTPRVLAHLKERWKMTEDNWHFLRGTEAASHEFAKQIGMRNYWTMDDHIIHDFKIVFFDAGTKQDRTLDFKQRNVASLLEQK